MVHAPSSCIGWASKSFLASRGVGEAILSLGLLLANTCRIHLVVVCIIYQTSRGRAESDQSLDFGGGGGGYDWVFCWFHIPVYSRCHGRLVAGGKRFKEALNTNPNRNDIRDPGNFSGVREKLRAFESHRKKMDRDRQKIDRNRNKIDRDRKKHGRE